MVEVNWTTAVNQIIGILNKNKERKLNILQKGYVLSRIWYIAQVLPMPPQIAQKINLQIDRFIWRGCAKRISRNTLVLEKPAGGIYLSDSLSKANSLLIRRTLITMNTVAGAYDYLDLNFQNPPINPRKLSHMKKLLKTIPHMGNTN
ncbi:hypothetical protein JTB14_035000 [Gonioctena quinquepunctata]|nr:hypothetical protein JTB14_035000 [Gonioctena quinquepunctata]